MPTIRDGRGQLTEYRVEPKGSPSGPVERAQVSEARMADFAAERVVPAAAEPAPRAWRAKGGGRPRTTPEQRQARIDTFLTAVRASSSHVDAGKRLGVSGARVAQFIGELRRGDLLPVDVDNMLRARAGQRPVATNGLSRAGLTDTENRRAGAATIESQGPEAGALARAADDRGTTEEAAPAAEVATPPGSPDLAPGLPCGDCRHAVVCSIRPELEDWLRDTPRPAAPHPAITVIVARLEVACEHFLGRAAS